MDLLNKAEVLSLQYHDFFDYPLTKSDLFRWKSGKRLKAASATKTVKVKYKDGYYFLAGREKIIKQRILREKASEKKLLLAEKTAEIFRKIPTIKMVAVTGSLAMRNADPESDIDLMIISKKGTLWTTRLIVLIVLIILRIPTRRFGDKHQKDKLCLNIWLGEGDLKWQEENFFTAHEIAQIIPLINKDKTYERFINSNSWIKKYWPKAIKYYESSIMNYGKKTNFLISIIHYSLFFILYLFEVVARSLQLAYMRRKITNEVVTPTRALFHPENLPLDKLKGCLIK